MRKLLATVAVLLMLLAVAACLRAQLHGLAGIFLGASVFVAEIFLVLGW